MPVAAQQSQKERKEGGFVHDETQQGDAIARKPKDYTGSKLWRFPEKAKKACKVRATGDRREVLGA
jgi:hypothetical protein